MKNLLVILFVTVVGVYSSFAQVEYTSGGGGNNFTLTYPANITTLTSGLSFTFKSNHTITGPSSISINGLAAISMKKEVSIDLEANDILLDQIVTIVFDGTNFQMTSKAGTSGGSLNSVIQDADGNTSINVEASPNKDVTF